jgi:hypothetical protein
VRRGPPLRGIRGTFAGGRTSSPSCVCGPVRCNASIARARRRWQRCMTGQERNEAAKAR